MTIGKSMPPEEALKLLTAMLKPGERRIDVEDQHSEGDEILCAVLRHLGHSDIADAWDRASERWFWWA